MMNVITLSLTVLTSAEACVPWLGNNELLSVNKYCRDAACQGVVKSIKNNQKSDGCMLRCPRCQKMVSARQGSFFAKSHLTLSTLLLLIFLWCVWCPLMVTLRLMQGSVSKSALVDWSNFNRDIASWYLLNNPVQLGGRGRVVEINETCIGGKRKYGRGRFRVGSFLLILT